MLLELPIPDSDEEVWCEPRVKMLVGPRLKHNKRAVKFYVPTNKGWELASARDFFNPSKSDCLEWFYGY